ncbi:hypothetical protein [Duffyella gerundensis]|uniref:hypothetical protein n=1 Tax=Duffyella TaxID=3026546 RepID=UPI003F6DE6EB
MKRPLRNGHARLSGSETDQGNTGNAGVILHNRYNAPFSEVDKINFLKDQECIVIIISAAAGITATPVIVRKNASIMWVKASRDHITWRNVMTIRPITLRPTFQEGSKICPGSARHE